MTLKDISHASNALGLIEQARQELMMIGDDAIYSKIESLESLYQEIADITERASGMKWE